MAASPPSTGPAHDIRGSYVRVIVVWLLQLLGLLQNAFCFALLGDVTSAGVNHLAFDVPHGLPLQPARAAVFTQVAIGKANQRLVGF